MTVRLTVTDAAPTTVQYTRLVTFGSAKAGGDSTATDSSAVAMLAPTPETPEAAMRGTDGLPIAYALHTARPNPSSGRAAIRYDLPEAADVSLGVVDVLGREVARLVEGRVEAGTHEAAADVSSLPSGVYVVRFRAGTFAATRTLTVAR